MLSFSCILTKSMHDVYVPTVLDVIEFILSMKSVGITLIKDLWNPTASSQGPLPYFSLEVVVVPHLVRYFTSKIGDT